MSRPDTQHKMSVSEAAAFSFSVIQSQSLPIALSLSLLFSQKLRTNAETRGAEFGQPLLLVCEWKVEREYIPPPRIVLCTVVTNATKRAILWGDDKRKPSRHCVLREKKRPQGLEIVGVISIVALELATLWPVLTCAVVGIPHTHIHTDRHTHIHVFDNSAHTHTYTESLHPTQSHR